MNALMETYGRSNAQCSLQILGFPCNQFGFQEPGENAYEIRNGLKYCRPGHGYEPNFPLFKKRDVNGLKEDKIFTFLKANCPRKDGYINDLSKIKWSPVKNNDISWNFVKFLIDHKGRPLRRFSPPITPKDMEEDIKEMIAKCQTENKGKKSRDSYNRESWKYDYL